MKNILDQETSPYLRQHRHNPVHWQVWGEEALALAQEMNRPILLSIGYASCHWCHVMAHESFEDPETAAVMNRHFINIKVDREERPDVDHIYQNALTAMGEAGGWPLTMFLDPQGNPFWGGTYFPPYPAYGRPAFKDILIHIATLYKENAGAIGQNRQMIAEALKHLNTPQRQLISIQQDHLNRAADTISDHVDDDNGGLRGAPKFPQVPVMNFLLNNARHNDSNGQRQQRQVLLTLQRICRGGIYDHIGGGFARYSTDAVWLVPHFEKMLYDNALMLGILAQCQRIQPHSLFVRTIEETITWLQKEMLTDDGVFAAAIDADSSEGEGSYYTWTPDEIIAVLGPDRGQRFCNIFDITTSGNWEGRSIPNLLRYDNSISDTEWADITTDKMNLYQARKQRPAPPCDDKVLTDWNALTISSLAILGRQFDRRDWYDLAERSWAVLTALNFRDGNLCHSSRNARRNNAVFLDDYAQMIAAALTLYQTSGNTGYLNQAIALQDRQDKLFWQEEMGAYAMAQQGSLPVQPMHCQDGATPAGNAVSMANHDLLWRLSGDSQYRRRYEQIKQCFAADCHKNVIGAAAYLYACEQALHPLDITLEIANTRQRERTLKTIYGIDTDVASIKWQDTKPQEQDKFEAMLCMGQRCTMPLHSLTELEQSLKESISTWHS